MIHIDDDRPPRVEGGADVAPVPCRVWYAWRNAGGGEQVRYWIVRSTPTETKALDGAPLFDSREDAEKWADKNIPFVSTGLEAILIQPFDETEVPTGPKGAKRPRDTNQFGKPTK
jgi:hypothetical protein